MPTSDSEDFESADEGNSTVDKKERKQRLSSSNYSDSPLESQPEPKKTPTAISMDKPKAKEKETDGWDDFDINEGDPVATNITTDKSTELSSSNSDCKKILEPESVNSQDTGWDDFGDWGDESSSKTEKKETDGWDDFDINEGDPVATNITTDKSTELSSSNSDCKKILEPESVNSQDTGWDDFGDWGDESSSKTEKPQKDLQAEIDPDIKEVTDRLAATATTTASSAGWGWGWGVDSLLSTATAGITTWTNQMSQGISTVLESSIGAPDPEELARRSAKENETKPSRSDDAVKAEDTEIVEPAESRASSGDAAFQFGSILSGVTKFVETTGTKVIAGGLDTLETIGKKTMEVLQDGDPGLAKKRAMLGLDPGDKPVLSQVLREAKAKAEEDDRIREEKREAKEVHYENLFDDFEGLVHLEALEMLSRQVSMRIDERVRAVPAEKKQDIKETLQQVAELCEMPEEEEEEEEASPDVSKPDAFRNRLQVATHDLGVKLQFQPLVKQYTEVLNWLCTSETDLTERAVYKRAVSGLAQATALSVEVYHKAAEMLLVKARRSTADEADALTQMTVVLTKHISELATLFTDKMNSIATENKEQVNNYITNIFLEAGNSSTYIQNAFQLALPILQIGAV